MLTKAGIVLFLVVNLNIQQTSWDLQNILEQIEKTKQPVLVENVKVKADSCPDRAYYADESYIYAKDPYRIVEWERLNEKKLYSKIKRTEEKFVICDEKGDVYLPEQLQPIHVEVEVENGKRIQDTMFNQDKNPFRIRFAIQSATPIQSIQWKTKREKGEIVKIEQKEDMYYGTLEVKNPQYVEYQINHTYRSRLPYRFVRDVKPPQVQLKYEGSYQMHDMPYFHGSMQAHLQGEECKVELYKDGKLILEDVRDFNIEQSGTYKLVCMDVSNNKKTFVWNVQVEPIKMWLDEENVLWIQDRNFRADRVSLPLDWQEKEGLHYFANWPEGIHDLNIEYTSLCNQNVQVHQTIVVDYQPPHSLHIQIENNTYHHAKRVIVHVIGQDDISGIDTFSWTYGSQKGRVKAKKNNNQYEADFVLEPEEHAYLKVQAMDACHHITSIQSEQKIVIDQTAPKLDWDIEAKPYVNHAIQGKIWIQDENWNPEGVRMYDGTKEVPLSFTSKGATFEVSEVGEHTFRLECMDLCGNTSTLKSSTYVIDKSSPFLQIQYKMKDTGYYNRPFTIRCQGEDESPFKIYARVNGKLKEDIHSITLTEDGTYSIEIYAVDQAGNVSKTITLPSIVLDTQIEKPKVQIQKGKNVKVQAKFEDENYKSSQIVVFKTSLFQPKKEWKLQSKKGNNEYVFHEDGIYECQMHMLDLAGNESFQTAHFVINKSGSTFKVSDFLQSILRKIPSDLKVHEYNLQPTQNKISIVKDGKLMHSVSYFKQNETIHILKDNFKDDGIYTIQIRSLDTSGNVNKQSIDFIVDSQAPEISCIKEMKENKLPYTLYDLSGLKKVEVYVDGKKVQSISNFSDINRYSSVVELKNTSRKQRVEIIAEDKAGNMAKRQLEVQTKKDVKPFIYAVFCILTVFLLKYKKA